MENQTGSEVWVQFFSEGFFGYGEKGDFKYFSLAHFIPIIILLAAILIVYLCRNKFRCWKGEQTFRFVYAFIMLMVEMSYFWRLLYVGSSHPDETNLLDKLPLQVCEWTCIISSFMIMKKSENLYQICFFVCLTAGLFPLITPAVITTTGPSYYRYYQYWLEHIMPIIAVFYMTFVHGFKPKLKGIFFSMGFLAVLAVLSVIANENIEGANYMYLAADTAGDSLANILPSNIYIRLAVFSVAFIALFIGLYFLSKYIIKKVDQKQLAVESSNVSEQTTDVNE